ncbi:MAG: RluA family pseudouridine synthase [Lachnospiraceae bacterium]|nr:RluA family pseudouridine synthase [Lachnospiraceae bacterium]
MDRQERITVSPENAGLRLDIFVTENTEGISRTLAKNQIEKNEILVNDKSSKPGYRVCAGDVITINEIETEDCEIKPENIPLDILYEDSDVAVINKPKGMVVHPAPGHYSGTLVNALMFHMGDSLSGINGVARPGIVHRIDRDTTGALIICKNDNAHLKISEQIAVHSVNRIYKGIILGATPVVEGVIDMPIGRHPVDRKKMSVHSKSSKEAVTHYRLLERLGDYSLMEFKLETGRTHQIRVHMSEIGHPLLGDEVYGPKKCKFNLEGQTLHAQTIGFVHPSTGEYMEFSAPLPEYFEHLLKILRQA